MTPPREAERGMALVMVLAFLVTITLLALGFTALGRAETRRSHNVLEAVRGRAILEAALVRTVDELGRPRPLWRLDGSAVRWRFAEVPVTIRIERESGKIDIEKGSEQLLAQLMPALGFARGEAAEIVDSLLDWRDADQLRRANGAERRDYARAGRVPGPTDGPFRHVGELRELLPMTPAAFARLEPYLTIYTGRDQPDPRLAAPVVQEAMAGLGIEAEEDHDGSRGRRGGSSGRVDAAAMPDSAIVPDRSGGSGHGTTVGDGSDSGGAFAESRARRAEQEARRDEERLGSSADDRAAVDLDPQNLYTVRMDALFPGGYEAHADVVIWMTGDAERPYHVLDWNPAPLRPEPGKG